MARSVTTREARGLAAVTAVTPLLLPRRTRTPFMTGLAVLYVAAWAGARQKYAACQERAERALALAEEGGQLASRGNDIADTIRAGHEALANFANDVLSIAGEAVAWLPPDDRGAFAVRLEDAVAKLTEHHPGGIT